MASEPATVLQPAWLASLPIWLQHRDKVPHYSGLRAPRPRAGDLDTPEDRKRLVALPALRLADGFEPGYALGPVGEHVLCGVDFDKCFGHDGKVVTPLKMFCAVAREAGAMIEVSRSGHGLHIVWLAVPEHVPATFKRPGIECYTGRRFFARGTRIVEPGAPTPLDMRPAFSHLPEPEVRKVTPRGALVTPGGRNNYLRERLEIFARAGLDGEQLKQALVDENQKLAEPLDERELHDTLFKGIDKLRIEPVRAPSEVFGPVETSARPSLGRPLGDGPDFDYDVVYHLIDRVLPLGGLTMLWGESTAGKSFLALDWALHLVYEMPWHGHKVRRGRVFYMAGEGEVGLKKRVVAWRKHHGITEPTGERFQIHNMKHVLAFEHLNTDEFTVPACDLIVIDTLNRWSDGDENKADDMGAWLRVTQKLSDLAGGAAVLIVHHARKDGDQYRGSTAIKAAVDAEFEIAGDRHGVSITHHKSKDEEIVKPMRLMKRSVALSEKDDGFGGRRMHTSLVLDAPVAGETVEVEVSMESNLLDALRRCGGEVHSRRALAEMVKGREALKFAAIRELEARGAVLPVGKFGLRLKVFDSVEGEPDIFS